MKENVYMGPRNFHQKTSRIHSARYTQCIHVGSHKLKLQKDIHTNKERATQTTRSLPKVRLYT